MLPKYIEIENFLSHSYSELNFEEFSSALIVGEYNGDSLRSNGAGKSAIFEAMSWVLFGQSRHKNSDNVIKRGSPLCKVVLLFEHDGRQFKIIRSRISKYSRMDIYLEEILEDGSIINMTADTNKATDALLKDIIKTSYDIFINSSYFRQNSFFAFAEGTSSTRQGLIGALLDLDRWNNYQKIAKESYKHVVSEVDTLQGRIEEVEASSLKLDITRGSIDQVDGELLNLEKEEYAVDEGIKNLELKLNTNAEEFKQLSKYKELSERITYNEELLANTKARLEVKNRELERINQDREGSKSAIISIDEQINKLADIISVQLDIPLKEMELALVEGKSKLRQFDAQIDNFINNDECSLCGHEWLNSEDKQNNLESKSKERHELNEKLKRAQNKVRLAQETVERARKAEIEIEKYSGKKMKLNSQIDTLAIKESVAEKYIVDERELIKKTNLQIDNIHNLLSKLDASVLIGSETDISIEIDSFKSKKKDIRKSIEAITFRKGQLTQEEKILTEQVDLHRKLLNNLADLQSKATVCGQLTKIFGRDGVQAIIIDNVIEEMTRVTNYWLQEFCHEQTQVEFITQKKSTKGDWKETLDVEIRTSSGICHFDDLSGGERFRISFAIRLALSHLQAQRMGGQTQVLMLDEVSTSLDQNGLETFIEIIRKLEKEVKVMVITHDDNLKEEFDTIITVRRDGEDSIILGESNGQ